MNKFLFVLALVTFSSIMAQAQSCTNALDESLQSLPKTLTKERPMAKNDLDSRCITAAMDVFLEWTHSLRLERQAANKKEIGHYGYCQSSDQDTVERLHTPPCASDVYVNVIKNAYTDVLKCLDLDPRRMFTITAVESGFYINTYSLSGQDIGIGQLIPGTIAEVNQFWQESVDELKKSKNVNCKNLRPFIKNLSPAPSEESPQQACSMMALPENPIRNLLYKGILHKYNSKKMSDYFEQSRVANRLKLLTGEDWTADELTKLQEVLVFLAYNAGFSGAKEIFESFLAEKKSAWSKDNDKILEMYGETIDYYLRAMDLQSQGYVEEAQELLLARKDLYEQMSLYSEDQKKTRLTKKHFFMSDDPGSFGDYLNQTKLSGYLQVLLGRIEYIELEMLQAPGLCAPQDILKSY